MQENLLAPATYATYADRSFGATNAAIFPRYFHAHIAQQNPFTTRHVSLFFSIADSFISFSIQINKLLQPNVCLILLKVWARCTRLNQALDCKKIMNLYFFR
jgi:hypothetical protein